MSELSARFTLKHSYFTGILLFIGMTIAILSLFFIPLPWFFLVLCGVPIVMIFYVAYQKHATLTHKEAIHGIRFSWNNNSVVLFDSKGEIIATGELEYYFVSIFLTTIIIRSHRRYITIIMPDSLPSEDYRLLRVFLNMKHLTSSTE